MDKDKLLIRFAVKQHSLPKINAQLEVATDPNIVADLNKEKKRLEKVLKDIENKKIIL